MSEGNSVQAGIHSEAEQVWPGAQTAGDCNTGTEMGNPEMTEEDDSDPGENRSEIIRIQKNQETWGTQEQARTRENLKQRSEKQETEDRALNRWLNRQQV